jgi:hypothetical protein
MSITCGYGEEEKKKDSQGEYFGREFHQEISSLLFSKISNEPFYQQPTKNGNRMSRSSGEPPERSRRRSGGVPGMINRSEV